MSVTPDIDDIAVERAVDGDLSVSLNADEMRMAWEQLEARGLSSYAIGATLGVSAAAVSKWRQGFRIPGARRRKKSRVVARA